MKCEKCNTIDGSAYRFYFGKKLGEKHERVVGAQITTTNYEIGGSKDVTLCNKCIIKHWFTRLATVLAFILFGVMLTLVGGPSFKLKGVVHLTTLQGIGLVIVCFGILFLMGILAASGKKDNGESLAISLNKNDLKSKGFDTFWDSEQFKKLEIKKG